MITIKDIINTREIYDYQMSMSFPYGFPVDYDIWEKSFLNDIDGEGRNIFRELRGKVAYENEKMVGFIQYGNSAIGFDENGEISSDLSYSVIRSFYFDEGYEETGRELLKTAMSDLGQSDRVYAFFHYFGMSCFARHGKLFEKYTWIAKVLQEYGFVIEHENVYYASELGKVQTLEDIDIIWKDRTKGNQQACDFMQGDNWIGECELHYLEKSNIVYLRWIYIDEKLQNQGMGSKCMNRLKHALVQRGFYKLDTDTAVDNLIAQRYYEKNGFSREGITRSYYRDSKIL